MNNKSATNSHAKLAFVFVGAKFGSQLLELMHKLNSWATHFIRCVKPHLNMIAKEFEGEHILSQFKCCRICGMTDMTGICGMTES